MYFQHRLRERKNHFREVVQTVEQIPLCILLRAKEIKEKYFINFAQACLPRITDINDDRRRSVSSVIGSENSHVTGYFDSLATFFFLSPTSFLFSSFYHHVSSSERVLKHQVKR